MKPSRILTYATMTMMAAVMASCSSDDLGSQFGGKEIDLTVDVYKPSLLDETRTALSEGTGESLGDLDCVWTANDQIVVTKANGDYVGYLTLDADYAGQDHGRFSGHLENLDDGTQTLKFYYLGTRLNAAAAVGQQEFSFANQDGTIASLSYNDLLYSQASVVVSGGDGICEGVKMEREFSFARFHLLMPNGIDVAGRTVTISGANVNNIATLKYAQPVEMTAGDINVTIQQGNEFYMTMLPAENITPIFTVTVGEKKYFGVLGAKSRNKGEYVRELLANGTVQGWPVEMMEDSGQGNNPGGEYGENDPDYPDYAGEDVRNPLHKFAKYNLVRVGERGSLINDLADDEIDHGALYQWGRNYGYMDGNKGPFENPALDCMYLNKSEYIHYADAMGDFSYDIENSEALFDYFVYQNRQEVNQGFCLTSGTGAHLNNSNQYFFEAPKTYSTLQVLKDNPTKYFMDASINSAFKSGGTYALMWENEECYPDYWLSSFGNGGTTWAARAEMCGYVETNPCPEGWRLPTLAEMQAIAPEGNGLDGGSSKNMQSLLSRNYGQVRSINGLMYAIRWLYNYDYLQIECVVDETLTSRTRLNATYWDNHANDKVVRKFPFTGAIAPLNIQYAGTELDDSQQIVRPYYRGVEMAYYNYDYWLLTIPGYWDIQYILNTPDDFQNTNGAYGGYWVEEKNYAFKFLAGEKYGTKASTSYIFVGSAEPVYGYAIRPVMDK